jgi:hypothetical protein
MLYYFNNQWRKQYEDTNNRTDYPTDYPEYYTETRRDSDGNYEWARDETGDVIRRQGEDGEIRLVPATFTVANEENIALNRAHREINEKNRVLNEANAKKNAIYDKVLLQATNTRGGDYLAQKAAFQNLSREAKDAGFNDTQINELFNAYNEFYKAEKIGAGWNVDLGSKPPAGDFDPNYYLAQNPQVKAKWDEAVRQGDLDILAQYKDPKTFALSDYTFVGKPAGKRGNKEQELTEAKQYLEKKPTDSDIQGIKDKQLGITYEALKEVRPGTELEEIASEEIGADIVKKTKQFGALTQDVLKDTIEEMQKAKAQEQLLSMMGGLPGFQEILNINQTLSDSILGDSGVGGILAFSGGGSKAEESLEKSLQKMTGVNTSTIYNWQQWFDNSLKKQYENDLELGLTKKEAEEKINVESNFARQFIDQYLIPRFNQSKTVSEFMEYVNVKDEEQNPFQTQDILNAAADVGQLKSQSYLDQIKQIQDAYFDPRFYFDPNNNLKSEQIKSLAGVKQQQESYQKQAETVAADWEEAKKQFAAQNGYWYQQAYRFGVDPNDKDAFAKLHFQVKGQAQGFDAAEDLWTPAKVQDYIYATILPAIKNQVDNMSIFGEFLKPDEFTDNLLSSANVNPEDKSTWGEVLKTFGLDTFQGSYDELKSYISDTFKTVSALELNEQLKELQKKGIKPTQKNLGVFYIEKPTDTAATPEGETALYKAFKQYGYAGDEKEFYENFFPDLDIEEQKLLTQAGGGTGGLKFIDLEKQDPLSAFGTIEKLMGGEEDGFTNIFSLGDKEDDEDKEDYFKLGLDDEDEDYKSKTGASILGEFTSFFKGF